MPTVDTAPWLLPGWRAATAAAARLLPDKVSGRGITTADAVTAAKKTEINPVALAAVLDVALGPAKDWHDWEPAHLREVLRLAADDVQQLDKVLAIQVALTNPDVGEIWPLFHAVCQAFNHRRAHFEWLEPLTPPELAWGVTCLFGLTPGLVLGPEVLRLIALHMHDAGLVWFPWVGGRGLSCLDPIATAAVPTGGGLADAALIDRLRTAWGTPGALEVEPDPSVDPADPVSVQLDALARCQAYIRAQGPADPYRVLD